MLSSDPSLKKTAKCNNTRGGSRRRVQGVRTLPPPVFCKKKTMWFIGVEVDQETSAPPPKKKSWIRPCLLS